MERKTYNQALIEALAFAEVSYSENRNLHTIYNGLIRCDQSYVNKQVEISRQLLDRLNEIASQYNLTDEQKGEINYYINDATQDVIKYQAEWDRMYCALRRQEEQRRRQERQQIQIRKIRRGKNLTKRHKARDRFMEEFSQISPEQWQVILRRADNQKADDNANFH